MSDARSEGYEGPSYYIGVDLGQSSDPSCLVIIAKSSQLPKASYEVVYIKRWPLKTEYRDVVKATATRATRPELRPLDCRPPRDLFEEFGGHTPIAPRPVLVIDATGVGRAIVELFAKENLPVEFWPMVITGGNDPTEDSWGDGRGTRVLRTPKQELVGTMQALLGTDRLKISNRLDHAELLKQELRDFRVRITKAAHEVYAAKEGAHDDLVLACAMPLWVAERPSNRGFWGPDPTRPAPRRPGDVIRGGAYPGPRGAFLR